MLDEQQVWTERITALADYRGLDKDDLVRLVGVQTYATFCYSCTDKVCADQVPISTVQALVEACGARLALVLPVEGSYPLTFYIGSGDESSDGSAGEVGSDSSLCPCADAQGS